MWGPSPYLGGGRGPQKGLQALARCDTLQGMEMKVYSFRLPPTVIDRLRKEAKRRKITVGALLRKALQTYMEQTK